MNHRKATISIKHNLWLDELDQPWFAILETTQDVIAWNSAFSALVRQAAPTVSEFETYKKLYQQSRLNLPDLQYVKSKLNNSEYISSGNENCAQHQWKHYPVKMTDSNDRFIIFTLKLTSNLANQIEKIYKEVVGPNIEKLDYPLDYVIGIKNYFEEILALIPEHIYWKDINGTYLGCNQQVVKNAGLSNRKDVIGKTDYDMPWHANADEVRRNDRTVIETAQPILLEEVSTWAWQKMPSTVLTRKIPLYDSKQKVIGVLGVSVDITDKKKAELAEKKTEELQAKLQGIKILAYSIAHEIRNPLGIVNLGIQRIVRKISSVKGSKSTIADDIKTVEQAAQKAETIINLILAYVKNETIQDDNFTQLSILPQLEKIIQQLPLSRKQRKNLVYHETVNFEYRGSAVLTEILFYNILNNAVHHISQEDKIYIWHEELEASHRLHIKDTGTGIPTDILDNIFEMGVSTKPIGQGAGIGLALCKIIMLAYKGNIDCISELGHYTDIILTFPKS